MNKKIEKISPFILDELYNDNVKTLEIINELFLDFVFLVSVLSLHFPGIEFALVFVFA